MSATSNHDVAQRLGVTTQQLDDGVTALRIGGELDPWTAPALCDHIEQRLEQPLLIDLSELQFCDTGGLQALGVAVRDGTRVVVLAPGHSGAAEAFAEAEAATFLPLAPDAKQALARLGD